MGASLAKNTVPSLPLVPSSSGLVTPPSRAARSGWRTTSRPSTTGAQGRKAASPCRNTAFVCPLWSCACRIVFSGRRCRHASVSLASLQPTRSRNRSALEAGLLRRAVGQPEGVALQDDGAEQAGAARDGEELEPRGHGACALACQRDARRVAAERADVALHPAQRELLIEQAQVGRHARRARQEPEDADPVVEGDDDDVLRSRPSGRRRRERVRPGRAAATEAPCTNPPPWTNTRTGNGPAGPDAPDGATPRALGACSARISRSAPLEARRRVRTGRSDARRNPHVQREAVLADRPGR